MTLPKTHIGPSLGWEIRSGVATQTHIGSGLPWEARIGGLWV